MPVGFPRFRALTFIDVVGSLLRRAVSSFDSLNWWIHHFERHSGRLENRLAARQVGGWNGEHDEPFRPSHCDINHPRIWLPRLTCTGARILA
jgi:hypothetical protein